MFKVGSFEFAIKVIDKYLKKSIQKLKYKAILMIIYYIYIKNQKNY